MIPDFDELRALVPIIECQPAHLRLWALKVAAITTGGVVHIPEPGPGGAVAPFRPVLASIEVHGVFAMSDTVEDLAANWVRVARTILAEADHSFPPARVAC